MDDKVYFQDYFKESTGKYLIKGSVDYETLNVVAEVYELLGKIHSNIELDRSKKNLHITTEYAVKFANEALNRLKECEQ